MNGKELSSDTGELLYAVIFEPEKLWKLWKEGGNLEAARYLAMKYLQGDEGNGIFRNPDKAREIYEEIGVSYEEKEIEDKETKRGTGRAPSTLLQPLYSNSTYL